MRGIAADIRPQVHRMAGFRKKVQIRAVRVIYGKRYAVPAAHGGQRGDIRGIAEIIGACDVDRRRRAGRAFQRIFKRPGTDRAFEIGMSVIVAKPHYVEIEERGGGNKRAVRVSRGEDKRSPVMPARSVRRRENEVQHRSDAVGRAFGGIKSGAAEETGGVLLAFTDYPLCAVQAVGAVDLRDVGRLKAERTCALVPRHMEPEGAEICVPAHKIAYGSLHFSPSSSRITATATAHSMRFLNSLQP